VERGSNALRLLVGVAVGIVVGEVTVGVLGDGAWAMALAVFAAMTIARALGTARVTTAQAAAGAILIGETSRPRAVKAGLQPHNSEPHRKTRAS
jgi:uncharacterized membrane protein YgaE (UPF0421/DUF939 family)